jgi:hypothetical protein
MKAQYPMRWKFVGSQSWTALFWAEQHLCNESKLFSHNGSITISKESIFEDLLCSIWLVWESGLELSSLKVCIYLHKL